LERYLDSELERNGFILADLPGLQAVESGPVIERAFISGRVDLFIAGDWEDADEITRRWLTWRHAQDAAASPTKKSRKATGHA
jgi:hypothetical protein